MFNLLKKLFHDTETLSLHEVYEFKLLVSRVSALEKKIFDMDKQIQSEKTNVVTIQPEKKS